MPRPCPVCGCDGSTDERTAEQYRLLWQGYEQIIGQIRADAFEKHVEPAFDSREALHAAMLVMFLPDRHRLPGFKLTSTTMSRRELAKFSDDVFAFWATKGVYVELQHA